VTHRAVVHALEGEELVDRLKRVGITRRDAHLAATREWCVVIADHASLLRHHTRAGYLVHPVHESGCAEVACCERGGDLLHMRTDRLDRAVVAGRVLQLDATAVGQIVEHVGRRVLVYAHGLR